MPTIECPKCQTSYPDVLAQCPGCAKPEPAAEKKPALDLKKLVPLIVIGDLVILAVMLYLFLPKH